MKLHRFIGKYDLTKNEVPIIDPEIIKQIKTVLRFKIGDKIILSDGAGNEAETTIISFSNKEVLCNVEKILPKKEDDKRINLFLAILKKENFELAVQKAVETGVSTITPIITERTIKTGLNNKRLEKIILEASEQCGRSIVPTLFPILDYEEALTKNSSSEDKTVFDLNGVKYLSNKTAKDSCLFIGPEGGFTEKEIELAKSLGYNIASLGNLTLRGETAAIVATYRTVNKI